MARIRSIKPGYATSEPMCAMPREVRLHFALLWTYVDDEGRGLDNPRLIKAAIWPLDDDVTPAVISEWQGVLESHGRIVRYEADGRRLFAVERFAEHQKPQKPTPSEWPPPPVGLPEGYANSTGGVASVVEGRGEGEEKETSVEEPSPAPPTEKPPPSSPTATEVVFDAWREATGRHRAVLDQKRRKLIITALRTYPPGDLVDAVRGWRHFPHNRGDNERRTIYNDLGLLLRDSEHIERFRDAERTGSNGARIPLCDRCGEPDGAAHTAHACDAVARSKATAHA
jgi:hypothetical protein